jgi:hypothetical protein
MYVLQITVVWTGSTWIYPVLYGSIEEAEKAKEVLHSKMSSTGNIKNNTIAIRTLV